MMNAHKWWGPALLAGPTWWGTAQAGRPCNASAPEAASVQRALGQACREEGPLRDGMTGPAIWREVHKLNECGSARAEPMRVNAPTPGSEFAWLQRIGLAVGAVTTVR